MSTANAYMHRSKYGLSGPGLNGAHLDFLGWLPMNRILYFGRFFLFFLILFTYNFYY